MSDTITVSSLEALYEALGSVGAGDTILVAPGSYGALYFGPQSDFDTTFPDGVTIASEDRKDPAIFSTLAMSNTHNLTIEHVVFDYTFSAGDFYYYRPFQVADSSNIEIRDSEFDGDMAEGVDAESDGYGWAYGLSVRDSNDVTLHGNEIHSFMRGLIVSESSDIDIHRNDVHSVRMDGMNFTAVNDVQIRGNYIHDFRGSPEAGDHTDMIQFWTNGTDTPSTNIEIKNNILDIGEGTLTHSIFMRNEEVDRGLAGEEMFYQNVSITNNIITNGHTHGINVGETNGLLIRQNTVTHADGETPDGLDLAVEIPTISVAETSTDVKIVRNITNAVTGHDDQSDWIVRNNVLVQDQDRSIDGYYEDVFIASSLAPEDGVHSFVALPGGLIEELKAGANPTRYPDLDAPVEARFHIDSAPENAALRHFDATMTVSDAGKFPENADFVWDFGDGTTATGAEVSHSFGDGGLYDVTLSVSRPDGTSDVQSMQVGVEGPKLLSLEGGSFVAYAFGDAVALAEESASSLMTSTAAVVTEGIDLSGGFIQIAREHVADINGSDDLSIDMSIQGNATDNAGEIMRLHGSFVVSTQSSGELLVRLYTDDGEETRLLTSGAGLNDLEAHDVTIRVRGDVLRVKVDGVDMGFERLSDDVTYTGTHDLTFGHPFGGVSYDGQLLDFEFHSNADDFEVSALQEETFALPETGIFEADSFEFQKAEDSMMADGDQTAAYAVVTGPAQAANSAYDTPEGDAFLRALFDETSATDDIFALI